MFINDLILNAVLENIKTDMQEIGKWSLLGHSKADPIRDKHIIDKIKKIDNAIEKLLILGINQDVIEKRFSKILEPLKSIRQ